MRYSIKLFFIFIQKFII